VSEDGIAKIYFGEGLEPDQKEFLSGLSRIQVHRLQGLSLEPQEVSQEANGDWGWFQFDNPGDQPILLNCDYGVFTRGKNSMRLNYSAKYLGTRNELPENRLLPLDIIPSIKGKKLIIKALFQQQAVKGCEIVVEFRDSGTAPVTTLTDENGNAEIDLLERKRMLIRGKMVRDEQGQVDGKHYREHRYYSTVVLDHTPKHIGRKMSRPTVSAKFPDLPVAITSFGAAQVGRDVYVFGGQMGEPHTYAKDWQNGKLMRMNIGDATPRWEIVNEQAGAQGLCLVAHNGVLYRIGGLEALNEIGAEHDLHSLACFQSFDPKVSQWTALPNLPEPRSSFDACVLDNKIYVVGGWTLRGGDTATWCDSALVFDLSDPAGRWKALPAPPFKRRGLSVIGIRHEVFAIGGIREDGKTSGEVDIFDVRENQWRTGPPLPDLGGLKGFGCTTFLLGDAVIVSVSSGHFFRYDRLKENWIRIEQTISPGRFFHRIVPFSSTHAMALGGANMEIGRFQEIAVIELKED
jgi:hypothetical protein